MLLLAILALVVLGMMVCSTARPKAAKEITIDELYKSIGQGVVENLNIDATSRSVTGSFKDGTRFKSQVADPSNLEKEAIARGIKITANSEGGGGGNFLLFWGPTILLILALIWLARRSSQANGPQLKSFITSNKETVGDWEARLGLSFEDVAGCEEAKEDARLYIEFLKNPGSFTDLGARLPRGLLFIGPPGTGKTLLAKAMAGEANVPFAYINGSDFVEMFVGVGASRVRALFTEAKRRAPCIIFIDELDAAGKARGMSNNYHPEQEQTLNAILAEMDGFKSDGGILVIGATNQPEVLDAALLRPGRFDRKVVVPLPDLKAREAILKVHGRKIKLVADADFSEIARGTPMASGADLANIVNEAAIFATLRKAIAVEQQDLRNGMDKALYGSERKSAVVPRKEMEIVAYHEAGHTLVAKFVPGVDPVRQVTIIPRGPTGGATHFLPEEDRHIHGKKYLTGRMTVAMGGRVAEMYKFKQETSGAREDFRAATGIAKSMVLELGMSERVGKRVFITRSEFLGSVSESLDCSPETRRIVDEEIKKFLDEAYDQASQIIEANAEKLEALAQALLAKETLTGKEVDEIIASA